VTGPAPNLTGATLGNLAVVPQVTVWVPSVCYLLADHSAIFMGVRMGVLDKLFGGSGKGAKGKADFSDVRSGGSSTAPSAPPAGSQHRTYTVVAGDSLSKIAQRQYGDASKWHRIFEANRDKIQNPDLIHPGQVLNIPQG
jgi:nucleoid-associated protein YgaU